MFYCRLCDMARAVITTAIMTLTRPTLVTLAAIDSPWIIVVFAG